MKYVTRQHISLCFQEDGRKGLYSDGLANFVINFFCSEWTSIYCLIGFRERRNNCCILRYIVNVSLAFDMLAVVLSVFAYLSLVYVAFFSSATIRLTAV